MPNIQKIGVTGFIYYDKRVLIIRRAKKEKFLPGYYELPGGKVEFGEEPWKALEREIREETNLNVKIIEPYSLFSYVSQGGIRHTVDIQFLVKLIGHPEKLKLSAAHDDAKWISKDDLKNYQISKNMTIAIKKGLAKLS